MSTDTPVSDLVINKLTYDQYKDVIDNGTYDNTELYEIKDISTVFSTQNGTISNCILEIPQNIKLTIENNTLYVETGTILTLEGETYRTATTTIRGSRSLSGIADGKYYIFTTPSGDYIYSFLNSRRIENIKSGSSLPETGTNEEIFYNTTDKRFYIYDNGWRYVTNNQTFVYPLGILEVVNGVAGFAKDSNGRDMIFNGACFIGHHAVVYPDIKGLQARGKSDDGKLLSYEIIRSSLSIVEMSGIITEPYQQKGYKRTIYATTNSGNAAQFTLNTVNTINEIDYAYAYHYSYVVDENKIVQWQNDSLEYVNRLPLLQFVIDETNIITDFTILQPVRLMKGVTYRQW